MKKVIILLSDGRAEILEQPDNVEVEIRDYAVDDDYDEDNNTCKTDKDGGRYQEIVFPAKE